MCVREFNVQFHQKLFVKRGIQERKKSLIGCFYYEKQSKWKSSRNHENLAKFTIVFSRDKNLELATLHYAQTTPKKVQKCVKIWIVYKGVSTLLSTCLMRLFFVDRHVDNKLQCGYVSINIDGVNRNSPSCLATTKIWNWQHCTMHKLPQKRYKNA